MIAIREVQDAKLFENCLLDERFYEFVRVALLKLFSLKENDFLTGSEMKIKGYTSPTGGLLGGPNLSGGFPHSSLFIYGHIK